MQVEILHLFEWKINNLFERTKTSSQKILENEMHLLRPTFIFDISMGLEKDGLKTLTKLNFS